MSYVFNKTAGSGGTTQMNFIVVGGTTQPVSPSTNMIWVNTSEEISGYSISNFMPENPSVGDVWIKMNSIGNIGLSIVSGSSEIDFHISDVRQYVNGDWISKESYVYQNNIWKAIDPASSCIIYDFTKDIRSGTFYDSEYGLFPVTLNNVILDSDGAHLTGASSRIYWDRFDLEDKVVDITFGSCTPSTGSSNGRLIMFTADRGIVLSGGNKWQLYNGDWQDVFPSKEMATNKSLFANSTARIVFHSDGRYHDAYLNGDLLYDNAWSGYHNSIAIGSGALSFYSITVKKMKIMTKAYANIV